ncbi:hypothetical protein GCM10010440_50080 [Kitasatospora cinereorecta]
MVARQDIRWRPRSRHRTDEDTRITSKRDEGTTTATALVRTAGLPSLVTERAAGSGGGARSDSSLGSPDPPRHPN